MWKFNNWKTRELIILLAPNFHKNSFYLSLTTFLLEVCGHLNSPKLPRLLKNKKSGSLSYQFMINPLRPYVYSQPPKHIIYKLNLVWKNIDLQKSKILIIIFYFNEYPKNQLWKFTFLPHLKTVWFFRFSWASVNFSTFWRVLLSSRSVKSSNSSRPSLYSNSACWIRTSILLCEIYLILFWVEAIEKIEYRIKNTINFSAQ